MRPLGVLIPLSTAAATPAYAQWQADLFLGAAYTPKSDMTLVVNTPAGNADHTFHDVHWDNSAEIGARGTYWFPSLPWYGVGFEIAAFDADIPKQSVNLTLQGATAPATLGEIDVSVMSLGLDLVRLRYRGTLEPYFSAGPALFRVKATNRGNAELSTRSATDDAWGYKVGAGLAWHVRQSIAIFGEYRYTHVKAEPVIDSGLSSSRIPLRFDLNTHHLVAGVSFGF